MKILPFLSQLKKDLQKENVVDYSISAEEILCFVLKISRSQLYLQPEYELTKDQIKAIAALIQKRAKKKIPLAYLLGKTDFYGCTIELSPDVLICRPETELLVDLIVQKLKKQPLKGKQLWDLCTGSGCIAIALKKTFGELSVSASDISKKALTLAKKNGIANKVTIDWREGDLLKPFKGEKADYIVCNPPYVTEEEYSTLSEEVKKEPQKALVSGKSGVEFYERLALLLPKYLNPGGKVFFEIGYTQKKSLQKLFSDSCWANPVALKDYAGKWRFFFVEIE